jgi:hypothetical protein
MRIPRLVLQASIAIVAFACSSSDNPGTSSTSATTSTGTGGAGGSVVAGADTTVTPFDKTHFYFTGSDNQRTIDVPASFPATGAYESITLHLTLECPTGGCDVYDRFASLGVLTQKGENGAPDTVIEIARFITPFHVGAAWDLDVTDLRPLLSGDLTLRGFVDTWVGPGSPYGAGWQLTASFEMKGGIPSPMPIAVVPVWSLRSAVYGDPSKPMATAIPAAMVSLPKASSYALRSFITGHGQGNASNCAEFCSRTHTFTVGSTQHSQAIWRTDCATTAAPGQQGTYQYSRGGWCPGADVKPWTFDVTPDVMGSDMATIGYEVETYDNTCRPDAMPCAGCTLGNSCAYDGGAHTEPNYEISSVLIAYR